MSIKKKGDAFVVTDSSGKKVLGRHPTRKQAVEQLQAIEVEKAARAGERFRNRKRR